MVASYPDVLPTFVEKVDNVDINWAADINRIQDEIEAITSELGTVPKAGFANVAARLSHLQTTKSDVGHDHDERYPRRILFTSKGTLIVGSSENTAASLPPGSDGQLLVSDSAQSTGLRWRTIAHADLPGLGADDHPQYLNLQRHAAVDHGPILNSVSITNLSDFTNEGAQAGFVPRWDGLKWVPALNDAARISGQTLAQLRDRATHTGTQPVSSLSDHNRANHDALGLTHNSLTGLTAGNPHTQYAHRTLAQTISGVWNFTARPTIAGNSVASYMDGGRNIWVRNTAPPLGSSFEGDIWVRP